jgi:mono/diheme cytochrome c family protein
MKMRGLRVLVPIGLTVLVVTISILSQHGSVQGEEKGQSVYMVKKPPESLDQYYPPIAEAPQYLFTMLAMEGSFTGMMTHLQDGDMAKAREYFKAFRAEYGKLAKMVPEWSRHYWPEKPLDDLSAALESGDGEKIGAAMPGLIQVCVKCHQDTMPAVWARYQKDMGEMGEAMFPLTGAFGTVNIYLAEGEFGKASKAMEGFQKLMNEFSESCGSCHDTERKYYVSEDVQALMKSVADELKKEKPDVEKIAGTMQKIGIESCYKCHKTHISTGNIQKAWGG